MQELVNMRYKVLNPLITTLIEQEKTFFGTCFSLINDFYGGI